VEFSRTEPTPRDLHQYVLRVYCWYSRRGVGAGDSRDAAFRPAKHGYHAMAKAFGRTGSTGWATRWRFPSKWRAGRRRCRPRTPSSAVVGLSATAGTTQDECKAEYGAGIHGKGSTHTGHYRAIREVGVLASVLRRKLPGGLRCSSTRAMKCCRTSNPRMVEWAIVRKRRGTDEHFANRAWRSARWFRWPTSPAS